MKLHRQKQGDGQKPAGMKKKTVALILCGVAAAGIATGTFLLFGEKEAASLTVSAGLQQFADEAYLAASAPAGSELCFSAEWFDDTLQGGAVSAITVTALPPVTEGQLLLGHGEVTVGQTIPRETLSYLRFIPQNGVRNSAFEFVPATESGTAGYALTCRLTVSDGVNCCPTGNKTVTAVSTHTALTLTGTLAAEDPEGDLLRYEVTAYPENGTLQLNAVTGAFTYLPQKDFAGADTFTWRAQDENGAFSDPVTVHITVRDLAPEALFTDAGNGNLQSAAQRVSEKGLMSGERMGGRSYFRPHHTLNRAAFVAILLEAVGVEYPAADNTGFADDGEIPDGMKGAIAYAKAQGWLGDGDNFRPGDPITRAEAAEIAAKVLDLSAPGYHEAVEDHTAIPVGVADAMYAIYEGGYISTLSDGTLAPLGELTRGDAAKFFAKILDGKSE